MDQPQQGSSTPTGVTATDPMPMQMNAGEPKVDGTWASEIGQGIEANIPGGRLAQRGLRKGPPQQE